MICVNDFFGVGWLINVVLMSDGNERSFAGVNGKVKIAADGSMDTFDDFEVVLLGEVFNIGIWGSSGNKNFGLLSLLSDGFDTCFKIRTFFVGENDKSVEII